MFSKLLYGIFFGGGEPESNSTGRSIDPLFLVRVRACNLNENGVRPCRCRMCSAREIPAYFDCTTATGAETRCCFACFEKYAAPGELEKATKRSKYAHRLWECTVALRSLEAEFPDPARRPLGEVTLRNELANPHSGNDNIERILVKISTQQWTRHDLARIAGLSYEEYCRREEEQG